MTSRPHGNGCGAAAGRNRGLRGGRRSRQRRAGTGHARRAAAPTASLLDVRHARPRPAFKSRVTSIRWKTSPAVIFAHRLRSIRRGSVQNRKRSVICSQSPVRKGKLAHALRHAARISPNRLVKVAESAQTRASSRTDLRAARRNAQVDSALGYLLFQRRSEIRNRAPQRAARA